MSHTSDASPIFVGGLYKSGTSLLRAMLSRHSNIAGGLETFWFDLDYSGKAAQDGNTRNWDATRSEPLHDHVTRLAKFFERDTDYVIKLAEQCSSGEEFLDCFMAEYATMNGKNRWVEKTPANVLHVERMHAYWPEGCFIHVVRDPRDVYSSVCRDGKWDEPETFVKLWTKFINAYEQAEKNVPEAFTMQVQYEDLVLNPMQIMEHILNFVGEPFEETTANYDGDPSDYHKVLELTGKSSTTLEKLSKPLLTSRIGAWKEELENPEDLAEVERIIKEKGFGELWESYKWEE